MRSYEVTVATSSGHGTITVAAASIADARAIVMRNAKFASVTILEIRKIGPVN